MTDVKGAIGGYQSAKWISGHSLDNCHDKSLVEILSEGDAQEFSYGFYEAQKAVDIAKTMGISNGNYLIFLYDEELPGVFCEKEFLFADDKQIKEMNGKSAYFLIVPKHSLTTLYASDFEEIKSAMNEYLKSDRKDEMHKDFGKVYPFKTIKDLEKVPFFDEDEFKYAYECTMRGYLPEDAKRFDLPKVHGDDIDVDLDSVCSVCNDRIKNIGWNNYLILETLCFDEYSINKKQDCYSTVIVGKLVDFKRVKTEDGLEEITGTVESIDEGDVAELFRTCREYGFKGRIGAWKIEDEELVPFRYSKVDMKSLKRKTLA